MTYSYEQWKDKSVSFNGNIYPMSLSRQSLRNFDTFINFVQLYLLIIKTRDYTSSESSAFYMKMYLLERRAEMSVSFHTGILKSHYTKQSRRRAWVYIIPLESYLLSTCHVKGTPQGQARDAETDVSFGMKKLSAGRADKQKSYNTRQDMGHVMRQ